MAKEGKNYKQILEFFFQGTEVAEREDALSH